MIFISLRHELLCKLFVPLSFLQTFYNLGGMENLFQSFNFSFLISALYCTVELSESIWQTAEVKMTQRVV